MSVASRISNATRALLGVSVYESEPNGPELGSSTTERIRESLGGQLQLLPTTQTQWFMGDLALAQQRADQGDLKTVAQLCRSMRRDGVIGGLTKTRTSGLVALPKRWRGNPGIVQELTSDGGTRSVFDEMFPPSEMAMLAADGLHCGIGVAELVPVVNRPYPVMVRLEPEYLWYMWSEGRWYYRSVAGMLPITPGDGRWVLHTPGGRLTPWQSGLWPALGRAFISKEHAMLHRANYSGKLANPARVAYAPQAATEGQRSGWFSKIMAWGVNSVFELLPGWDIKLLESNGRGWEVFGTEIETANLESMITLAGQVVTVTGGTGFANADIHQSIRADLIKETGDGLSYTINTQGLPAYVAIRHGVEALKDCPRYEYDTTPAEDRKTEAEALSGVAKAITDLLTALETARNQGDDKRASKIQLDVDALIHKFGVPLLDTGKID